MLCEKCKKNEARINLVKVVNGEKYEIWLCENCAKDISDIPFLNSIGEGINFPFQGIISGILSNVENVKERPKNTVCSNCGLTYDEFKKNGKLGCGNCYKEFSNLLETKIKKIQTGSKHVGKIPKINGKDIIQRRELKSLKLQLQNLISNEEYERAAVVRDKIKKVELYIQENNIQEKEVNVKEEKCSEKLD